jgi:hypothetical protein
MKKEKPRRKPREKENLRPTNQEGDYDYYSMRGGETKTERSGNSVRCSPEKEVEEYSLVPTLDRMYPLYKSPTRNIPESSSKRPNPYVMEENVSKK